MQGDTPMLKLSAVVVLALAMGLPLATSAQDLDMRGSSGSSAFEQAGKPTRGMTQDSVVSNFGNPQSMSDAVGEPPISRWEYAGFVVFFEYDRVIHAVTKR
jgi:hypothetical protein